MITPFRQPLQIICIALLLIGTSAITACNRNKECKAIVTVLNMANAPQSGVQVKLIPNGSCPSPPCNTIAPLTASTDGSGKASFTTDLPKIMDVEVVLPSGNMVTGKVVRFEEGETDEVTVKIS
jgi:hypothetical protein